MVVVVVVVVDRNVYTTEEISLNKGAIVIGKKNPPNPLFPSSYGFKNLGINLIGFGLEEKKSQYSTNQVV